MRARVATSALLLVALAGCDGPPDTPDAGSPDAGAWTLTPPAPPAPPEGECPTGWTRLDEPPTSCTAYAGGFDRCMPHESQPPGRAHCSPVGRVCGAEAFADPAATGRTLYVAEGGAGDGSLDTPFGALSEALAAANDDDTILLGRGRFAVPEELWLESPVTIRGVCPSVTTLYATTASEEDALFSVRAPVSLRDLTITGPRIGLWVELAGVLSASGVVFADLAEAAVVVDGDATVEDSVLRMTSAPTGGNLNAGVVVNGRGARLTLRRVEARGFRDVAVQATAAASTVVVEDSVLGARYDDEDVPHGGRIMEVYGGTDATLSRVVIDGGDTVGVYVEDPGTSVTLEDVDIEGIDGASSGAGVVVKGGAEVTARRVTVGACLSHGFAAFGRDTHLVVEDSYLAYQGVPGALGGAGIEAGEGASIEVRRTEVLGNEYAGIVALGSTVSIADVRVTDVAFTRPVPERGSAGIYLDESHAMLERVAVSDVEFISVAITGGTAILRDVLVEHTTTNDLLGTAFGVFSLEAITRVERLRVIDTGYVGIGAMTGGTLDLQDVEVDGAYATACADVDCTLTAGGIGVAAYDGATVVVDRFRVARAELAGLQVAYGTADDGSESIRPGALRPSRGVVEENLVGLSVQVPEFEFDAAATITFRNNERNIDSDALPVARPPTL